MASENLLNIIENETAGAADELDADTLDRILIEPHQEALAEAILADVVDITPILGDLAAMVRQHRAEKQGIEYPDSPAYLENTIGDLPKPIDTVADIVISQNVLLYLSRKYGIEFADDVNEINTQVAESVGSVVDSTTPDEGGPSLPPS